MMTRPAFVRALLSAYPGGAALIMKATLAVAVFVHSTGAADMNGVLREVYLNIPGVLVSDLTSHPSFPANPSAEEVLTSGFEAPTDVAEEYGQRLRALLVPPTTGNYTFWLASDDGGELYLSEDDTPAAKTQIAAVPGWTSSREFTRYPEQESAPVRLVSGQRYYIEALMKEGGGGDNLAVQWRLPNGTVQTPIPHANLLVYGLTAPVVSSQPSNLSVAEGEPATFSVQVERSSGMTYQWQRDGADIPGATGPVLFLETTSLADDGAVFRCFLENAQGSLYTGEAILTVSSDNIPPTIVSARNLGGAASVTVVFSEALDPESATDPANYTLNQGVEVLSARLGSDGRSVVLITSGLEAGASYTIQVSNVRDLATVPNTIAQGSETDFSLVLLPLDAEILRGETEPAGPSSRGTPLAITELMYHPADAGGSNLEFIEIYNSDAVPMDLTGFRIAGDVEFSFPDGTSLAAKSYLVIAAVPADVAAHYSRSGVLGPWSGELPNNGGTVRLENRFGAALLEVEYDDDWPWPLAADGAGHSLVLARPSYGEKDPTAWGASRVPGGSPGLVEPAGPRTLNSVFINEFLAHTDEPQLDFVELYNYGSNPADVSGCFLSDDRNTNKFQIPAGTVIPAGGFLAFDQTELGFALSTSGEEIYLRAPDGERVLDAVRFEAQPNGISSGRFPDGAPAFQFLAMPTPGLGNASVRQSPVVINELMYNPISRRDDEEFVELHNISEAAVSLAGWQFVDGIDFTFPPGAAIAAGGYVVVAKNAAVFSQMHPTVPVEIIYGDYSGSLANSGERVALARLEEIPATGGQGGGTAIYVLEDEVIYKDGGRWPEWADAGGSSLELIDPRSDNRLASNWAASDESGKSTWTDIEHTGVLDHGQGAIDELHVFLLGEGEALVDDLEVVPQGGGNQVPNGDFEGGLEGWVIQGTHVDSGLSESGLGYDSDGALHLRASSGGDNGANRVEIDLNTTLSPGSTATIRGKARWLGGYPDLLLRLHGNHLEAVGQLNVPSNLGTPGQPNSRLQQNAGPAIYSVSHAPVLPAASQSVTVRAQVNDPDGLANLTLLYRLDPATNYTRLAMTHRGAGFYTAVIPGQVSGRTVAFFIEAGDAGEGAATTLFPADAPAREGLIRFGEVKPNSDFGTYRLWLTAATVQKWSTRQRLSNHTLDGTFVYNDYRVIYNSGSRYRGSPFIRPGYNSPIGNLCAYVIDMPKDDLFLGEDKLNLDSLEPGRDDTSQREKMSFWIAEQLNIPTSQLRYIQLYVNGVRRSDIYTDSQRPDGAMVERWYPEDNAGDLYKIDDWFEFNDEVSREFNIDARLENYTTTGGVKKQARYRWPWEKKPNGGLNDSYQSLFDLVDALNTAGPAYTTAVESLVDVEEWMRIFAVRHIVGDWDGYGYNRGKNMFTYKPERRGWQMLLWDLDFALGAGGDSPTHDLFQSNDPTVTRMYNHPPFRRAYLRALWDAANGPLLSNRIGPVMQANHAALTANGVSANSPASIQGYVDARRTYINQQVAQENASFAITSNGGADFSISGGNLFTLAGTAPVQVRTITINGAPYPVEWESVTGWRIRIPLQEGVNTLAVRGFDSYGQPTAGAADDINVTYNGTVGDPRDHLVINEIMYHPTVPNAEFVEVHNHSATDSYDLTGYQLDGIGFDFPEGTIIAPGGFVVVARDLAVFRNTYGTGIPVAGEYAGTLQPGGETLSLIRRGADGAPDEVVSSVTYSSQAPWPAEAAGAGASLQLIDPTQGSSHPGNWGAAEISAEPLEPRAVLNMESPWRYDDSGTDRGTGWRNVAYNDSQWPVGMGLLYVENSPLPAPKNTPLDLGSTTYYFRTRFTNSFSTGVPLTLGLNTIVDDGVIFYLNGQELLRVGMPAGSISASTFSDRVVGEATLETFEVPGTATVAGVNVLAAEVHQTSAGSSDVVFGAALELRPAVTGPYSPGAPNTIGGALPEFPLVRLNEVQPRNEHGPVDQMDEHEPWVEIYNGGDAEVSLTGYFLTDDYSNPTKWSFPAEAVLAPGEFRLVWLDAQSGQGTASDWHANFTINVEQGALGLFRESGGSVVLVDYLDFMSVPEDQSFGRYPDGAADLHYFAQATPDEANTLAAAPVTVFINEWMASNTLQPDPADGAFDDWFELYNAGSTPANLSGFTLTDSPGNPAKSVIPLGTIIPAGGFLLVWADEQREQNGFDSSLHADFKLGRSGESIGLYAPDGTLVDLVTFGEQADNLSEGRMPDGGAAPFARFEVSTPGASNGGTPPGDVVFSGIGVNGSGEITLSWEGEAGVNYVVQVKGSLNDPEWIDLEEISGTGALSFTDEEGMAADQRFYRLIIRP